MQFRGLILFFSKLTDADHLRTLWLGGPGRAPHGIVRPYNVVKGPCGSEGALGGSAGASLNEAPQATAVGPQFCGDLFLVDTLLNNDRLLVVTVHKVYWALNVALSSLTLLLCQRIRPFTTNKALSGPPLHHDRALLPSRLPRSGSSGVVCCGSALKYV